MPEPKSSRSKQVSSGKIKPVLPDNSSLFRRDISSLFQKMRAGAEQRRQTRALENLAAVHDRAPDSSNAEPSGQFLPGVKLIPLQDLAARWKRSPAMVREAANTGLFRIVVVVKEDGWIDHWYLDQSLWPHGSKRFTVPGHGIIHTLLDPSIHGLKFPATLTLLFPIEEVTRIEEENQINAPVAYKVPVIPKLLTLKECAGHANKSTKTLRRMIKEKTLRAKKIRGSWRIDQNDLYSCLSIKGHD